jgi:hypothetical protein
MCKKVDVVICTPDRDAALDLIKSNFAGSVFEAKFDDEGKHIAGTMFLDGKCHIKSIPYQEKCDENILYDKAKKASLYKFGDKDFTFFYEPNICLAIFEKHLSFSDFFDFFN